MAGQQLCAAGLIPGTQLQRETCSVPREDGNNDTAWQTGPLDHSGFINTGTLTVNPGKDPPQAPIQNIRQSDQSLSSHNPKHYLHLTFIRPRKEQGCIKRRGCSC
ncbi:hypothetical protein JOQ06_029658 [Pogonophryne albipinna]|uniref:Uncharacterized protein n=1 Tax=Pogonophryne albipinna TaxID=1090488 RepID=A0AAD6FFE8_9TELE|nr:hypothetical protein JOQ06_029658 [Pogonophryne albipinna]